ncbi:MAG: DUF4258 domain-containing protein [Anaerolineae bacterium]
MAEQPQEGTGALPYREELFAGRTALRLSEHALREAHKEGLRGRDIVYAIFTGEVVERYPHRRRALISGPYRGSDLHLHIVCDYSDYDEIVVATVYIPSRSRWSSHRQRRH